MGNITQINDSAGTAYDLNNRYIELTGASGTLTTEQLNILLASPKNFIVYYDNPARYICRLTVNAGAWATPTVLVYEGIEMATNATIIHGFRITRTTRAYERYRRVLMWTDNGNATISGTLTVGTGPTNNMDVATKQYVDTHSSSATTATATLTSAGWSNNQQTVTVTGVTANNTLIISPAPANTQLYSMCNVYATIQAANSLTFQCETTPYADLVVNVVML